MFLRWRGGGTDPHGEKSEFGMGAGRENVSHGEKSEFGLGDIAMSTEVSGCE